MRRHPWYPETRLLQHIQSSASDPKKLKVFYDSSPSFLDWTGDNRACVMLDHRPSAALEGLGEDMHQVPIITCNIWCYFFFRICLELFCDRLWARKLMLLRRDLILEFAAPCRTSVSVNHVTRTASERNIQTSTSQVHFLVILHCTYEQWACYDAR